MRTREKSKAQLLKELNALKELVQDRDAQIALLRKDSAALRTLELTHAEVLSDRDAKRQEVYDLRQEVATRKASEVGAQRRFDLEREEHVRTQTDRYKKMERIRELEKLLVHGGKTIGALTELAAEKYKHDDLPF